MSLGWLRGSFNYCFSFLLGGEREGKVCSWIKVADRSLATRGHRQLGYGRVKGTAMEGLGHWKDRMRTTEG